jgi:ABC-2 type transport system permease protein
MADDRASEGRDAVGVDARGDRRGHVREVFKLWRLYGRMDLLWIAQAKSTAAIWYFSELIVGLAVVTSTYLLAERFDGIGIWSKEQILFLLGYSLLVRGLVEMFFGWNVAFISRRIGRGQLDHMLLQPRPLWMLIVSEGFSPLSGSGLVLAAIFVLGLSPLQTSPGWIALFSINVVASTAVVVAFSYLWGCLAFWAPRTAEEINSTTMHLLDQLRSFPLDGLSAGLLGGLFTLVPVAFVAWYPAKSLLGLDTLALGVYATPCFALVFGAFAAAIFKRGLNHYAETGSTRYLSLGHRR